MDLPTIAPLTPAVAVTEPEVLKDSQCRIYTARSYSAWVG